MLLGYLSNSKEDIRRSTGPPSDWLLGVDKEFWSQESDAQERQRFDQVLETVLSELEPICLSEQNFCVSFFQLDVLSSTIKVYNYLFIILLTDLNYYLKIEISLFVKIFNYNFKYLNVNLTQIQNKLNIFTGSE